MNRYRLFFSPLIPYLCFNLIYVSFILFLTILCKSVLSRVCVLVVRVYDVYHHAGQRSSERASPPPWEAGSLPSPLLTLPRHFSN